MQIINIKERPKIVITKELQTLISYYHNKFGAIEWSGPLFYEIVNGSIETPESLVINALHVHLMNVHSAGYTEYDFTPENFMDVFDDFPDLLGKKIGHLHTHHSMETFFSGTDTTELHDNSAKYNYYLSLIVNFNGKYTAKIAIKGKYKKEYREFSFEYKGDNEDDSKMLFSSTDENADAIAEITCDVVYEVPQSIIDLAAKVEKQKTVTPNVYNYGNYSNVGFNQAKPIVNNSYNKVTDLQMGNFLAKLLLGNKQADNTIYNALTIFDRTWVTNNANNKQYAMNRIKQDFKGYYQSAFKITPSNEILKDAASECKHWVLTYKSGFQCYESLFNLFNDLETKYEEQSNKKNQTNLNFKTNNNDDYFFGDYSYRGKGYY
jgi:hypothetical protein